MKIRVLAGLHVDVSPINSAAGGVDIAQVEQRFHPNDRAKDVCA